MTSLEQDNRFDDEIIEKLQEKVHLSYEASVGGKALETLSDGSHLVFRYHKFQ